MTLEFKSQYYYELNTAALFNVFYLEDKIDLKFQNILTTFGYVTAELISGKAVEI